MSETLTYFQKMQLIKLGLLPKEAVAKAKKPIKKVSDKRAAENKQAKDIGESELDKWFKEREKDIVDMGSRCMETGEVIPKAYYRHCTAHLMPKARFPSVSTHPLNFVVLSASNGSHFKFDVGVSEAKKMKVFPEAAERYLQFKHLIIEKHKYLNEFEDAVNEYLKTKDVRK